MMVHFFPYPFFAGLIILITILVKYNIKRMPTSYLVIFSLMWIYLLFVVGLTIFPIPYNGDFQTLKESDQIGLVFSRINLIPFQYLSWYNLRSMFFEIVLNILLTVPFGFLINYFSKFNSKSILWISIASGLVIETSQLIMSLFIGPYRTVDISDVILNAMGCFIGFLLYKISAWFVHNN